jgi:hypothetical protein
MLGSSGIDKWGAPFSAFAVRVRKALAGNILQAFPSLQQNTDKVSKLHASKTDIKLAQSPKSTEELPASSAKA